MAKLNKSQLQSEIAKLEAGLKSSATPEQFKPKLKEKLEGFQAQLAELEKAPKKSFKTTKEKSAEKKKVKPSKPAEKTPKKKDEDDDKELESVTIQGITLTKADCPDGYAAFKEYKANKKKSAAKSDAKPEINKGRNSIEVGINHIVDSISKSTMEKEPKAVAKALTSFQNHMDKAFDSLRPILSKTQLDELNKSLKTIDKILADIKG